MRPIQAVIAKIPPPSTVTLEPAAPAPPLTRRDVVTPLAEMTTEHLRPEQRARLQAAIDGAARWLAERQKFPNRSFVVTGPVGTGKTTIIENIRNAYRIAMCATDWDGRPIPGTEIEISSGRFITSTALMSLLNPGHVMVDGWGEVGRTSLEQMFGRVDVIAVDDCGREQIPYTAAANIEAVRQSRYWEFMDWCYRRGKTILLTSNIPLLVANSSGQAAVNPAFVAIMGDAAFSRLHEMAAGFMFDLTGLPDYRRVIATKNRGKQ